MRSSNGFDNMVYLPLSVFISKEHIRTLITTLSLAYGTIVIIISIVINLTITAMLDTSREQIIDILDLDSNSSLELLCKAVDCVYIQNNNTLVYESDRPDHTEYLRGVELKSYLDNENKYLNIRTIDVQANADNYEIGICYDDYITSIINRLRYLAWLIIIPILTYYIVRVYGIEKKSLLEKRNYKYTIEGQIQRNLTESLYHELNNPMSIIRTLIEDLYESIFYCDVTNTMCKRMTNPNDKSNKDIPCECKFTDLKYRNIANHYEIINSALDQIHSTITIMADVKVIKYNTNDASIYTVITNAISSCNILNVVKLTPSYGSLEILNSYSLTGKLNNGDLLNALTVLINNAVEAQSTKLDITASITEDKRMHIYIKDNGTGVKNKDGVVTLDNSIFNYGKSTKDKVKVSWLTKLLYKIGIDITGKKQGVRGAGLALSKELLNHNNGDILLKETTPKGSVFEIIVPVKQMRNKK